MAGLIDLHRHREIHRGGAISVSTKSFNVAEIADDTGSWGISEEINIDGELVELRPDPLIIGLIGGNDHAKFSAGVRQQIAVCEDQGGYVEDIKLSTAALGVSVVQYTALVMCRVPKEDDES